MAKDQFGSFLQEAMGEHYGDKVSEIVFKEMVDGLMRIEWTIVGDDLKIHLYRNGKWPLHYSRQKLYPLMDKHAPGEERDIGYEDMPNSWYIICKGYSTSKLNPEMSAEILCQKLLASLAS